MCNHDRFDEENSLNEIPQEYRIIITADSKGGILSVSNYATHWCADCLEEFNFDKL